MMGPALFASFFLSVDLLLGRVRHLLPAHPLRRHAAGRDLELPCAPGLNPKTNAVGSLVFAVSVVSCVLVELMLLRAQAGMTAPLELQRHRQRFGAAPPRWPISPRRCRRAAYACCSGPRAPARRRCCRSSAAFSRRARGEVLIGGADCTALPPAKRPTTTVFQDYALFPHMSVGGNVGFGLRMRGVRAPSAPQRGSRRPGARRSGRVREQAHPRALRRPAPARRAGARAGRRAGGAAARRAARRPRPQALRRQMQDELKAIQKRVGTAFVHVTHDQEEAMALADLRRDEPGPDRG